MNSLLKYSEVWVLNYQQSLRKMILLRFPIQTDKCNGPLGDLKSESPGQLPVASKQLSSWLDYPASIVSYFEQVICLNFRYAPNWYNPCFSPTCLSFSLCSTTLKLRLMNNSFPLMETIFIEFSEFSKCDKFKLSVPLTWWLSGKMLAYHTRGNQIKSFLIQQKWFRENPYNFGWGHRVITSNHR